MSRPRTRTSLARPAPPRMAAVECPLCAHPNARDAKFCNSCGARVDLVTCRACEAINSRESAACYSCGASLSRRAGADRTTRATTASPLLEPSSEIVPVAPETSSPPDFVSELPGPLTEREVPATPENPALVATPAPAADDAIATAHAESTATPPLRRRWMRSMVLLVPIAAAVGFLAYPRGDLEPPVTPRVSSPSPGNSAGAGAIPAPTATGATAAPSDSANAAPAPPNDSDAPEEQPASGDAAVVETPTHVDKPVSSVSSAPTRDTRQHDTRQSSRSRTQRAAVAAPATEAPTDATSATLREQISAGSRRPVSCTVEAAALGLCATR